MLDLDSWTVDLDSAGKDPDSDSSSRGLRVSCKFNMSAAKFLCFFFFPSIFGRGIV